MQQKQASRLSSIIQDITMSKDNLNKRAIQLDKWVCRYHKILTLLGGLTYAVESIVGLVVLTTEWAKREVEVVRVFLLLRICSYLYLIWASYDRSLDFEASHPGLHLTYTMVHTICVVTLLSASKRALRTMQGIVMLVTVIVDNALLFITFFTLRKMRQVVDDAIRANEINDIHPATRRYLDFIPPADRDKEEVTARHLLWQTVHVFEEFHEHIEERAQAKKEAREAESSSSQHEVVSQ